MFCKVFNYPELLFYYPATPPVLDLSRNFRERDVIAQNFIENHLKLSKAWLQSAELEQLRVCKSNRFFVIRRNPIIFIEQKKFRRVC